MTKPYTEILDDDELAEIKPPTSRRKPGTISEKELERMLERLPAIRERVESTARPRQISAAEVSDDDVADTVERALRSYRRGAEPGPIEQVAIASIRRGGDR